MCTVLTATRKYLERIEFYQQRVFSCSLSKKKGLTFEEALISENNVKKQTQDLPECYLRFICENAHCSMQHTELYSLPR